MNKFQYDQLQSAAETVERLLKLLNEKKKKTASDFRYEVQLIILCESFQPVFKAISDEPTRLVPFWSEELIRAIDSCTIDTDMTYEYEITVEENHEYSLTLYYDDGKGGHDTFEFPNYAVDEDALQDVEQLKKAGYKVHAVLQDQ